MSNNNNLDKTEKEIYMYTKAHRNVSHLRVASVKRATQYLL